jgi:iron(III) transport system substrate-binding protein
MTGVKVRWVLVAVGLLAVVGAVVITVNRGGGGPQPVVVYSARAGAAMRPALEAFRKRSHLTVTLVEGDGRDLEDRLVGEKGHPRADVFVGTDTSTYERVAREGIFFPYASPAEQGLSGLYRSKDHYGRGIAGRAWVIIYNKALVKAADTPQSVFDLAQARWKSQVAVAGYQSRATLYWTQALVSVLGEEKAKAYVERLTANGLQILSDDQAVREGVAQGRFAVGLADSADTFQAIAAGAPVGLVYPDQAQTRSEPWCSPTSWPP